MSRGGWWVSVGEGDAAVGTVWVTWLQEGGQALETVSIREQILPRSLLKEGRLAIP